MKSKLPVVLAAAAVFPLLAYAQSAPDAGAEPTIRRRSDLGARPDMAVTTARVASQDVPNVRGPSGPTRITTQALGPSAPPPDTAAAGPIGATDAIRILRGFRPQFQSCYTGAFPAGQAQTAGNVVVNVTLGPDGAVTDATANGMADKPDVATCLARTLRTLHFPRPEGGRLQFSDRILFAPATPARPVREHHHRSHGHH